MRKTWHNAVVDAIHRYSLRHQTRLITRQGLIEEEMTGIIQQSESEGETPTQTLSRVLQELRDEGVLYFSAQAGKYILIDDDVAVITEEYPDDVIEFAIRSRKATFPDITTGEIAVARRQRVGQNILRKLVLENYNHCCALCDVTNSRFLVASHIARWADDIENRGNLANAICFCRVHDSLFEEGYFSISDDFKIISKPNLDSTYISQVISLSSFFKLPSSVIPESSFLHQHRKRCGY